MNLEDIIRMAHEADREWDCDRDMYEWLETFAEQVAESARKDYSFTHSQLWLTRINKAVKAEREACAKVCEDLDFSDWQDRGWDQGTYDCANAIRARGCSSLCHQDEPCMVSTDGKCNARGNP